MELSFEIGGSRLQEDGIPGVIEIYLDAAGRDDLVNRLKGLCNASDHTHLFADSWGGEDDLAETPRGESMFAAKHVKITLL